MKRMAKVTVVIVLALALCQSAMAAPTQGAYMATTNSSNLGLFDHFLGLLGAIWGDPNHGAIWCLGNGSADSGAIWGDPNHASVLSPVTVDSKGLTTEGAIWGCGN